MSAIGSPTQPVYINDSGVATPTGIDLSTFATKEEVKSMIQSGGGMFIDILGGNKPIEFPIENQAIQMPCNGMLIPLQSSTTSISGDNSDWTSFDFNYGGTIGIIPIKRGSYVKTNVKKGIIFFPCEKYDESIWHFDAGVGVTSWLPKTTGRYRVEMAGGKSGDVTMSGWGIYSATVTGSYHGANGRKLIFNIVIETIAQIRISIGTNGDNRSSDLSTWGSEIFLEGNVGGNTLFGNISANGGTAAKIKGQAGLGVVFEGSDGTTPNPPTEDEVRNGLPEGVTYVEGSYDGSGTSDHGYISISKIEENTET